MTIPRALRTTVLTTALVLTPVAAAADGDLDASFGGSGVVITEVSGAQLGWRAAAVQADGKYVVGGRLFAFPTGQQALVARYNADGTLDTTFGSNGLATPFGGPGASVGGVFALPDGDILVVGGASSGPSPPQCVLARLNHDGTPDTAFGVGGVFAVGRPCTASARAIDGQLVIVSGATVTRLEAGGSLDTTFGDGGTATLSLGAPTAIFAVSLAGDGHIVVSGATGSSPTSAFVARLQADGSVDTSFGENGITRMQFGRPINIAARTTIADDGRILVAAQGADATGAEAVGVRLTSTGALDSSFGTEGTLVLPEMTNLARIIVQRDGKLLAVGSGGDTFTGLTAFVTKRLNPDGTLDPVFGDGGVARTDVGLNGFASDAMLTSAGLTVFGQNRSSAAMTRYSIAANLAFASFAPRVTLEADAVAFKASFALGDASNGIDPPVEGIELALGPHAATIEGASLRAGVGRWKYEGPLFGATADVQLVATGGRTYELKLVLTDVPFSLAEALDVRLAIGDDAGSAVARLDD